MSQIRAIIRDSLRALNGRQWQGSANRLWWGGIEQRKEAEPTNMQGCKNETCRQNVVMVKKIKENVIRYKKLMIWY